VLPAKGISTKCQEEKLARDGKWRQAVASSGKRRQAAASGGKQWQAVASGGKRRQGRTTADEAHLAAPCRQPRIGDGEPWGALS